jgi:hypothetical protein
VINKVLPFDRSVYKHLEGWMRVKVTLIALAVTAMFALGNRHLTNASRADISKAVSADKTSGYLDDSACVFPADGKELDVMLQKMRVTPDNECLRQLGWDHFKTLTSAPRSAEPDWLNWCAIYTRPSNGNTYLACPPGGLPNSRSAPDAQAENTSEAVNLRNLIASQSPRQLAVPPPGFPDASGAMQEVLLNPTTSQTVLKCFQSGSPLVNSGLTEFRIDLANVHSECSSVTNGDVFGLLGSDSIAVKLVWYVILDASSQIRVWDSELQGAESTIGQGVSNWNTLLNVKLTQSNCPPIDPVSGVRDPVAPDQSYLGLPHRSVNIGCFYSTSFTNEEIQTALDFDTQLDKLNLTGTLQSVRKHTARKDDSNAQIYLALLAFHVATRETTDWTWQTYWWSGRTAVPCERRGEGCLYRGNPEANSNADQDLRWSHYVMNATLGQRDKDHAAERVYNPYLEGQVPPGPDTNCLNCHQYAVFHKQNAPALFGAAQQRANSGLKLPIHGCTSSESGDVDGKDGGLLKDGIKTDCLWSLASSNVAQRGGTPLLKVLSKILFLEDHLSRKHVP